MTRKSIGSILVLFTASGLGLAQTAPATQSTPQNAAPLQSAGPADAYGQPQQRTAATPAATRPAYGLPQQVTLKAGTFVTVRNNEMLASNKSHVGDSFSGTLTQPLVVDGVVVAERGQTIYGRVAQAEKVKGVSHLGVELTGITLADGEQVTVHSQLISRQGGRMPRGAQAGTIVGTTGVGTVIGAIAGGGTGAGIGAGAGAAAGIIGVIETRNRPSVLYPETALTFQIQNPLTIATGSAPQAFRFVGPDDFARRSNQPVQQMAPARGYNPNYYGYGPYAYGYPYYPYWGSGLYLGGFWGGGWGWGGGFGRFGGGFGRGGFGRR